jgi:hypothetical protein
MKDVVDASPGRKLKTVGQLPYALQDGKWPGIARASLRFARGSRTEWSGEEGAATRLRRSSPAASVRAVAGSTGSMGGGGRP